MRFPNLRYGNPTEFAYYAMGRTLAELARALRRDERTIRDWLSGRARVPWWVPELMRLQRLELQQRQCQMFGVAERDRAARKLGVVQSSGVLELAPEMKKARQDVGLVSGDRRAVTR